MKSFKCEHCLAPIYLPDSHSEASAICETCNTRQPVPANTIYVEQKPSPLPEPVRSNKPRKKQAMPRYVFMLISGYVLMALGVLITVYGLIIAGSSREGFLLTGFTLSLNGIVSVGFGQLLHCIRDMAIHSWERKLAAETA